MANNIEKYYKSFGLDRSIPRSFLKKQELNQLFVIPKKETHSQMPHFYNFVEDNTHQADILFLPTDKVNNKNYAYALVVVDVATGNTDAEPLVKQEGWSGPISKDVVNAITKIYKRSYLKIPALLITDSGREFTSDDFQNFLKKKNIEWKKAVGGRHRQVGMVERRNYTIGRAIMMRQFAESMITQKETVHWVKFLPELMKYINERFHHDPYTDEDLYKKFGDPWQEKTQIIPVGTKVRVMLTEPKDFKERGIKGHFRAGDQRYAQDIYQIIGYVFDPHQPILYKINKKLKPHERAVYTRQQLQIVNSDEEDVPASIAYTNTSGEYAIRRLVDKRQVGNRTQYLVQWRGYPMSEATWESKSNIPKSFVNAYEGKLY